MAQARWPTEHLGTVADRDPRPPLALAPGQGDGGAVALRRPGVASDGTVEYHSNKSNNMFEYKRLKLGENQKKYRITTTTTDRATGNSIGTPKISKT